MTIYSFDKIVGYEEEKKSLISLCSLIQKREQLKKMGGKLPRGLLLIGPNGCGKTVLAEAFIQESNCNCVRIDSNEIASDDEFVDYIKDKLYEASKKTPCIIFADEIDKLIGMNDSFFNPSSLDKDRVMLNEINKYSNIEGMFFLFVANEQFALEPSMKRSGRIDRIIRIDYPNEQERENILNYYLNNVKKSANVDAKYLSSVTQGLSGADLESIINNSVIRAFTDNREEISKEDFMACYCDKIFRSEGKDSNTSESKSRIIATHEAGHAAMSLLLDKNLVSFVTIVSRSNLEGFVMTRKSEKSIVSLNDKLDSIKIAFAGAVAEEVILGDRGDGSISDIQRAAVTVAELVQRDGYCGMDKITIIDRGFPSATLSNISDKRLCLIEEAQSKLMRETYQDTVNIIKENKAFVIRLADELVKNKSLDRDQVIQLYNEYHSPINKQANNSSNAVYAKES